jgi:hypothetical protein
VDSVALIVTALAAGAGSAVQDEAPDAVKDAYARLLSGVRQRLSARRDGELALARYEAAPQTWHVSLMSALTQANAGNDAVLSAAAMAVMELLDEAGVRAGKYTATISGSQGVQSGSGNSQFNFFIPEYTGQRTEAEAAGPPAGRLLADVSDPFDLEVHRPVQADDPPPGLPVLPHYVSRDHDRQLAEVVRAAAEGASRIAVLVGGSSTGKTRACWEALALLRERPQPWRLWHPIEPARPEAALRELPSIGPHSVVWLNEAQLYLDAAGGLGERVGAGLRKLLRDPARAPVLVLVTLWPQFWGQLTVRPVAGEDRHSQARELLAGQDISVPTAFTATELRQMANTADPRLIQAAETAEGGQVIQFLAGAPELMARYRNAPPAATALMDAALDARRLGMGIALPLAFLEAAAPGYLTDSDWDGLDEDWLEQAFAYVAAPCKGIRGPLARIRPRITSSADRNRGPTYRLADYLEQYGRRVRPHIPPADFWDAADRFADPADLPVLASGAEEYGLLSTATRLRKHAIVYGDTAQATILVRDWYSQHPHTTDPRPAQWAAAHAALDDPGAVALLLSTFRHVGADEQAAALLARDPAGHAVLDKQRGVIELLRALREAGAAEQAAALASRAAVRVSLDDPRAVAQLLDAMRKTGKKQQVAPLLARNPAAHTALDKPESVAELLSALRRAGAEQQIATLLARDPAAYASVDKPGGLAELLGALRETGAAEQGAVLADRAAARVSLDDPRAVAQLLDAMREAGAEQQIATLLARHPAAHADLDNRNVGDLLVALLKVGAEQQATALVDRAALQNPGALASMLHSLDRAGAEEQAAALAERVAAYAVLDDPRTVADLLIRMKRVSGGRHVAALLARDPAAHATLDDLDAVFLLLFALRVDGTKKQFATLAKRVAADVTLEDPYAVARLLGHLGHFGAVKQAAALAKRAVAHVPLDDPGILGALLSAMQYAGAEKQVAALLARDPAAHATLEHGEGVALLLAALREADAEQQVARLLARDPAAHAAFGRDDDIFRLLDALQEAGAERQIGTLLERLPTEGWFDLFRRHFDHEMRYKFGRELDGSPASPWGWDDLA